MRIISTVVGPAKLEDIIAPELRTKICTDQRVIGVVLGGGDDVAKAIEVNPMLCRFRKNFTVIGRCFLKAKLLKPPPTAISDQHRNVQFFQRS